MNIGFTGTRDGMTEAQHATVAQLMYELRPQAAHHGDCVGADAQFHALWQPDRAVVAATRIRRSPYEDAERIESRARLRA